jgi:hypothetical protein
VRPALRRTLAITRAAGQLCLEVQPLLRLVMEEDFAAKGRMGRKEDLSASSFANFAFFRGKSIRPAAWTLTSSAAP